MWNYSVDVERMKKQIKNCSVDVEKFRTKKKKFWRRPPETHPHRPFHAANTAMPPPADPATAARFQQWCGAAAAGAHPLLDTLSQLHCPILQYIVIGFTNKF